MEVSSDVFTDKLRKYLQVYSRWALSNYLYPGLPAPKQPDGLPDEHFGVFVTLRRNGKIRGEKGTISSEFPLLDTLCEMTIRAANTPEAPAIELTELPAIIIEIMLITEQKTICASTPVHLIASLKPNVHGLTLENTNRFAYLLPEQWQTFSEHHRFIDAIIKKGGWDNNSWPMGLKATRFKTVSFKESFTRPTR